jgi:hypothetical protein
MFNVKTWNCRRDYNQSLATLLYRVECGNFDYELLLAAAAPRKIHIFSGVTIKVIMEVMLEEVALAIISVKFFQE